MRLEYRPPLDWSGLLDFYAQRAIPGVESVTNQSYRRSVRLVDGHGWFAVRQAPDAHALELTVAVDAHHLPELAARVRRMFDLDTDPSAVSAVLGDDPLLGPVIARCAGLRVPGAWDPFEIAVRAILGQQISVAAARTLAYRLAHELGDVMGAAPTAGLERLFPTPERLADAPLERLGVFGSRAQAIRELARQVSAGSIDFHGPALAEQLVALPGIGDWTAQYVALRTGNDPDAFPASDLGLLRGAEQDQRMTPARLRKCAEAWRPWRGYAAICLWRRYSDQTAKP